MRGHLRYKSIPVLPERNTKPTLTPQRVKEALFNILDNYPLDRMKSTFWDVYAGSGQIGIEALSRGFGHVVFCELNKRKMHHLQQWLRTNDCLGNKYLGQITFKQANGMYMIKQYVLMRYTDVKGPPLDHKNIVIFLDPPYEAYHRDDRLHRQMEYLLEAIKHIKHYQQIFVCAQASKRSRFILNKFDKIYTYGNNILATQYTNVTC